MTTWFQSLKSNTCRIWDLPQISRQGTHQPNADKHEDIAWEIKIWTVMSGQATGEKTTTLNMTWPFTMFCPCMTINKNNHVKYKNHQLTWCHILWQAKCRTRPLGMSLNCIHLHGQNMVVVWSSPAVNPYRYIKSSFMHWWPSLNLVAKSNFWSWNIWQKTSIIWASREADADCSTLLESIGAVSHPTWGNIANEITDLSTYGPKYGANETNEAKTLVGVQY